MDVSPDAIASVAPLAIGAIMAAACGDAGDLEAEEHARKLPLDFQAEVVELALRMTFPGGFGPFVDRITEIANRFGDYGRKPAST
jgi:hypothetical protein